MEECELHEERLLHVALILLLEGLLPLPTFLVLPLLRPFTVFQSRSYRLYPFPCKLFPLKSPHLFRFDLSFFVFDM